MTKDDLVYLDLTGEAHKSLENIKLLAQLSARDMTATLLHNLKYFTTKNSEERALGKKISFLTIWIVTDVMTPQGAELLKNALTFMVRWIFKSLFDLQHFRLTNFTIHFTENFIKYAHCIYSEYRRC